MLELKINDKTYQIKFGYEATIKSGILKKMVKMASEMEEGSAFEMVDEIMNFIPEMLLVGLQRNHREEFLYDYKTEKGKDEALSKSYELLDEYFEDGEKNIMDLFSDLQEEMTSNGFLSKMFQMEQEKVQEQKK